MTTDQVNKVIELAIYYSSIGTTMKSLSKRTYELRESGTDIPYVNSAGVVVPTKKQKNWKFLVDQEITDSKLESGFIAIRIADTTDGLLVVVTSTRNRDNNRSFNYLYSSRPILDKVSTTILMTGSEKWKERQDDIFIL